MDKQFTLTKTTLISLFSYIEINITGLLCRIVKNLIVTTLRVIGRKKEIEK